MDWEQIGYTLVHGGVMGYAQILDERNKNKARDIRHSGGWFETFSHKENIHFCFPTLSGLTFGGHYREPRDCGTF